MQNVHVGLFSISHELMCVLNPEGGLLDLSPSWRETTGFEVEALRQKTLLELAHPDDRLEYESCLVDAVRGAGHGGSDGMAGGAVIGAVLRVRHSDGSYLWVKWRFVRHDATTVIASGKDVSQELKSHSRLKQLEENSNIGTWEIDLETQYLHWSEQTHRIHETDPFSYKPKLDDGIRFYHPSSVPIITSLVEEMMATGRGFDVNLRFVTAKGNLIWVRSIARAQMRDGKVVRCYGSFQNITVEYEQQEAIREAKERFDVVVNNIPVVLCMVGQDKRFEWVNQGWLHELGWDVESMAERDMLFEFCPDSDERQRYADFVRSGASGFRDFCLQRRDGTKVHMSWANVRLSNGKTIGIGQNISARKEIEAELQRTHAELEKFFSVSVDMHCVAGLDGYFKRVNPAFSRILGYSENELLSRPILDFIHPDDLERTANEVRTLEIAQKGVAFENRYRHRDGHYRILSWLSGRDEKTGLIYAAARDVTREREMERDLKQILAALDRSAIVAITDKKGKILSANQKFVELSGYSLEELIGKDHRIVNSGAHGKEFIRDLWQTILAGKVWNGELQNRRKNGEPYWVQTCISPLYDPSGEIERFIAIRIDVTARKTAEAKMLNSAKLASLGEMAAGVAHEVNNPLAIIHGKCDQLIDRLQQGSLGNEAPDRDLKDLKKIAETSQRIARIVRALLSFSRDFKVGAFAPVNVRSIIEDSLELCRERFKNHGVELRLRIDGDFVIDCQPIQIGQVMLNLLNNAFDAVQGLDERWVEVFLARQGSAIVIAVTDSGAGIPRETAVKLMQPFFTTKEVGKGTGLGLSISKGIVEQHGGQLLYDQASKNTRFVVELAESKAKSLAS